MYLPICTRLWDFGKSKTQEEKKSEAGLLFAVSQTQRLPMAGKCCNLLGDNSEDNQCTAAVLDSRCFFTFSITCRYTRVANSGFPHHTIALLRPVSGRYDGPDAPAMRKSRPMQE